MNICICTEDVTFDGLEFKDGEIYPYFTETQYKNKPAYYVMNGYQNKVRITKNEFEKHFEPNERT